jgi:hypothetical protein
MVREVLGVLGVLTCAASAVAQPSGDAIYRG